MALTGAEKNKRYRERLRREDPVRFAQWQQENRTRSLAWRLSELGLTLADWQAMWDAQGGRCAICGDTMDGLQNCHADHNHTTGKPRKLLCRRCNVMLGMALDNIGTLERAVAYLREHEEG